MATRLKKEGQIKNPIYARSVFTHKKLNLRQEIFSHAKIGVTIVRLLSLELNHPRKRENKTA